MKSVQDSTWRRSIEGSNEWVFTGDDFSNWSRCRAESRLAINLGTTVVLDASYVTGTGQAGRFILNDIKKQAGDLCAQIVLSPCCSSRKTWGGAGPRNTEGMHRLFTFCRHLIAPSPSPSSTISAALNPAFSQCCHAIWCFLCRSFHAVSPRGSPVSPMRQRGNNLFYRRLSQNCPVDTRPELIIIHDLGARVVARNIF